MIASVRTGLRMFGALALLLGTVATARAQAVDTFNPAGNDRIYGMALQPNGQVVVVGAFSAFGCDPSCLPATYTSRKKLARFNADGNIDTGFDPGAISDVSAVIVQPDGKILIGGSFTSVGGSNGQGTTHHYFARLDANGAVDLGFDPGVNMNSDVQALARQTDGKILVGGLFTGGLGGGVRSYFGRVNADGTLDTTFSAGADGPVSSIAVQPDGKILVGGAFTHLGGQLRNHIGRLDATGALDLGFDPGASGDVNTILVQADGKILLGGNFTGLGGSTGTTLRARIGRVDATGAVDAGFDPGANGIVYALAEQTDGRLVIGGSFTTLGGGGSGTSTRLGIGRLDASGALDATFNPGTNGSAFAANASVYALLIQPDGKVLVGGDFTTLGGGTGTTTRRYLGRLLNSDPAVQSLTVGAGGTSLTWLRSGASPEVTRVEFASSTDGVNYTALGTGNGAGTRIAGGWRITGIILPSGGTLTVRARGYYATGKQSASGSITELTAAASSVNVIDNGDFSNGLSGWSEFASPANGLVSQITNGVYEFYRTGTQAVIFRNTNVAVGNNSAIAAQFELGNSSNVKKRVSVLIHESDFSDLSVCTFWLPANSPLTTYAMRTHTTKAWVNLSISFYAASLGSAGTGFYQLDNVLAQYDPTGSTTSTVCVDATAPTPPGGAAGSELLLNGDFASGTVAPGWSTFGNINGAVTGGVFEFNKLTAATPVGVLLQPTSQAMTANQLLTATFQLGNSSGVRKRVTVILHDNNFSDLSACTFWLAPGQALSSYTYRSFATQAWTNATLSVYPATVGAEQWMRLDNVSLQRTPSATITGAECTEPGIGPGTPMQAPPLPRGSTASAASRPTYLVAGPPIRRTATGVATAPTDAAAGLQTRRDPTSAVVAGSGDWQHIVGGVWSATAETSSDSALRWAEAIDLRGASGATITFMSALTTRGSWAEIMVRTTGGAWLPVWTIGQTDAWQPIAIDLSGFAGGSVDVQFVFHGVAAPGGVEPDTWQVGEFGVETVAP